MTIAVIVERVWQRRPVRVVGSGAFRGTNILESIRGTIALKLLERARHGYRLKANAYEAVAGASRRWRSRTKPLPTASVACLRTLFFLGVLHQYHY